MCLRCRIETGLLLDGCNAAHFLFSFHDILFPFSLLLTFVPPALPPKPTQPDRKEKRRRRIPANFSTLEHAFFSRLNFPSSPFFGSRDGRFSFFLHQHLYHHTKKQHHSQTRIPTTTTTPRHQKPHRSHPPQRTISLPHRCSDIKKNPNVKRQQKLYNLQQNDEE